MPDGTKPTPTHTPRTTMINFRAPVELDERLTALAIDRRTTKTALLLNAVERLCKGPGSAVEAAATRQAVREVEGLSRQDKD